MNIKFAGTVEAAKDYIRQNNLERYDIDNMFKNVEENYSCICFSFKF